MSSPGFGNFTTGGNEGKVEAVANDRKAETRGEENERQGRMRGYACNLLSCAFEGGAHCVFPRTVRLSVNLSR